jgi:hypothetical protein
MQHQYFHTFRNWVVSLLAIQAVILLVACCSVARAEDLKTNLLNPNQPQSPPGVSPPPGAAPPIGSGDTPPTLTPGDGGAPKGPPSGQAFSPPITGSKFGTKDEQSRTTGQQQMNIDANSNFEGTPVNKKNLAGGSRLQSPGPHGVGPGSGDVTEDDLAAQQEAQYPSPYTADSEQADGKKHLGLDTYNTTHKRYADSKPFDLPPNSTFLSSKSRLITVRQFARFLVKLGVVFATVLMILAALSVLMGSRDGGSRVVSSAAGLMLLLCGYTIWKVVMYNTHYFDDQLKGDRYNEAWDRSKTGVNNLHGLAANTTPKAPASGGGGRSNMKVQPLGGSVFR